MGLFAPGRRPNVPVPPHVPVNLLAESGERQGSTVDRDRGCDVVEVVRLRSLLRRRLVTIPLTARLTPYTVSLSAPRRLAFATAKTAVAAVIDFPFIGSQHTAPLVQGAYADGKQLHVSQTLALADALSRSTSTPLGRMRSTRTACASPNSSPRTHNGYGYPQGELAERHGISVSSVKRLLSAREPRSS
jgi:hypothetical protein